MRPEQVREYSRDQLAGHDHMQRPDHDHGIERALAQMVGARPPCRHCSKSHARTRKPHATSVPVYWAASYTARPALPRVDIVNTSICFNEGAGFLERIELTVAIASPVARV